MQIDLPQLVATYGYAAAFLGAALEGETVLTLTGLAARRGNLSWPMLWMLAAMGATIGDSVFFAIGRRYGESVLSRWPSLAPAVARVHSIVLKRPALAVIGVRFLYGMRIAGPVVIGASALPWRRFLLLNFCGALIWASVWLTAGYLLGAAAERLLGHVADIERALFIAVIAGVVLVFVIAKLRRRNLGSPR